GLRPRRAPVPGPTAGPNRDESGFHRFAGAFPLAAPGRAPRAGADARRHVHLRGPRAAGDLGRRPTMRVVVNVERCRGAGLCALTAPEVFDQDERDGTVVLLDAEPPPELHHD